MVEKVIVGVCLIVWFWFGLNALLNGEPVSAVMFVAYPLLVLIIRSRRWHV